MVRIPEETLAYWREGDCPLASDDDIERIEALAGAPLSPDYTSFLRSHGFVLWDIDTPNSFDYSLKAGGGTVLREGSITHLETIQSLTRIMSYARDNDPSRGLPRWPANYFPVAGTAGYDAILMELSPQNGRIWFWPEREGSWGTGDNKALGRVADSFTAFIEDLRIGSDG